MGQCNKICNVTISFPFCERIIIKYKDKKDTVISFLVMPDIFMSNEGYYGKGVCDGHRGC